MSNLHKTKQLKVRCRPGQGGGRGGAGDAVGQGLGSTPLCHRGRGNRRGLHRAGLQLDAKGRVRPDRRVWRLRPLHRRPLLRSHLRPQGRRRDQGLRSGVDS